VVVAVTSLGIIILMILQGDAAVLLKDFNDNCIDLTVTSPPYDNLRTYGGYSFNFENISRELYRVTKDGGIVVWIINDSSLDGDESGTSFKQVIQFKDIGFKLHDTMIYAKTGIASPHPNRYHQIFEFMFILSKGKLKTFNPIIDRHNIGFKRVITGKTRRTDDILSERIGYKISEYGLRYNIWVYHSGGENLEHPATFPQALAEDHIKSWSNEGDLILDPFSGSGTSCIAAHKLNRKWIGIEINPEYVALSKKRLTPYIQQQRMEKFIETD
jgi:DNA modification methylase